MIVYGLIAAGAVAIFFVTYILPLRRAKALVEKASMIPRRFNVPIGAEKPSQTFVFVGDSVFAGVGASCWGTTLVYRIVSALGSPVVRVINASWSKARAKDLVDQIKEASPISQGSVVFIFIGGNDATHLTSVREFRNHLDQALRKVSDAGSRTVIATIPNLSFIPALRGSGRLFNLRARKLNAVIRGLARLHGALLADIYESRLASSKLYAADGFHANDAGYAQWASCYQTSWPAD